VETNYKKNNKNMNKNELYERYLNIVSSYENFVCLSTILKNIIDNISEEHLVDLKYDIVEIEILTSINNDKIVKFENLLKKIIKNYNIENLEIDTTNIQNLYSRVLSKMDDNFLKNIGETENIELKEKLNEDEIKDVINLLNK
jgi:hypothetical protein